MYLQELAFADIVPLPFRSLLFVQLGIHLWYALVWISYKVYGINVLALLNLSYSPHKFATVSYLDESRYGEFATVSPADLSENQRLLNGIYRNIKKTLLPNLSGLAIYWVAAPFLTNDSRLLTLIRVILPTVLLFHTLYRFFWQSRTIATVRVKTTIKRILLGDINSVTMRTNDILLSDTLISYAKIINDCSMFFWKTYVPTDLKYNAELETFMLSIPSLIRMKQCWFEFLLTKQKQHFFNFIKYFMGLGPNICNLLIKLKMAQLTEDVDASAQLNQLNRWWYLISAISASYLFLWDVKMDWGFSLFDIIFDQDKSNWKILREPNKLVYNSNLVYYGIISLDFVLRFIWLLKLFVIKETEVRLGLTNKVGNFLFGLDFLSIGYAVLEALEILRRWLWCFLKLESDLVKLQFGDVGNAIPLSSVKIG